MTGHPQRFTHHSVPLPSRIYGERDFLLILDGRGTLWSCKMIIHIENKDVWLIWSSGWRTSMILHQLSWPLMSVGSHTSLCHAMKRSSCSERKIWNSTQRHSPLILWCLYWDVSLITNLHEEYKNQPHFLVEWERRVCCQKHIHNQCWVVFIMLRERNHRIALSARQLWPCFDGFVDVVNVTPRSFHHHRQTRPGYMFSQWKPAKQLHPKLIANTCSMKKVDQPPMMHLSLAVCENVARQDMGLPAGRYAKRAHNQ